MRTLIAIGGAAPDALPVHETYDRVIAADSGYDTALGLGLEPDVFVGDGDSTEKRAELEAAGVEFASVKKDDTDFTLAVRMTEGDYDLIGGGEGRLDHTIGIFSTFVNERAPKMWLTREDAVFSGTDFDLELPPDTLISFFPVDLRGNAIVRTDGLEWNLMYRNVDLSFFSLSNRTAAEKVRIRATAPIFVRLPLKTLAGKYKIKSC